VNQRSALARQRNKTDEIKEAIEQIEKHTAEVRTYEGELPGLIGLEGSAARIYFKNHFNNVEWKGRKPRIKSDYVNSTLDIGYTILFGIVESLLKLYGFDLYQGVLHRQFYMRKSLVCDLVEPLRPLIDIQIKKSINLGQCKAEDFQVIDGRNVLSWDKNKDYIYFLMKPILEHKREIFLYIQGYYRKFMKGSQAEDFPYFNIDRDEGE